MIDTLLNLYIYPSLYRTCWRKKLTSCKRSALFFFLFMLPAFCLSCATLHDLELYRLKGDSITVIYEQHWENAYDVMKVVLSNDEDIFAFFERMRCTFEFEKGNKRIRLKMDGVGIGTSIYFIPVSDSSTRVEFVRSRFHKLFINDKDIDRIIKKTRDILNQNAMLSWC